MAAPAKRVNGGFPNSSVILDADGNLYGTTIAGEAGGVVYKVDTTGNETVLYTFTASEKYSLGVTRDAAGNLYGATASGGASDNGMVYKLDAAANLTVLYSFMGGDDGESPVSSVVLDPAGNIYGAAGGGAKAGGVIYEVQP
jgi:uncharacterized repeat protein (TIGR03803 family)